MKFGDIIEEIRQDKGLYQKDLAKILNVSVATISHYESNINMPDIETICLLADYFGVSVDYILGRTTLKMDWNTFKRSVKLSDGTYTTMDKVMTTFLKLSDESQTEVIKLMELFKMKDDKRHIKLKRPPNTKPLI
ncbi:MAG TPA: helix-turn-helix transcriptional regulator [Ruminiclostridium sp.]